MATYLLTGCAGFIGARVAQFLLVAGNSVVGWDNLNDAYDATLKHKRLEQLTSLPGFSFYPTDICNLPELRKILGERFSHDNQRVEAIINLAARAGVRQSVLDPWVYYNTNVLGTLNLLELCREFGIKKFILASSSSLYGNDCPRPFKEDFETNRLPSPYSASKKAAESLCYSYHFMYALDIAVLRYFTVFGPYGRPDMSLFRFVQWIFEDRPVVIFGNGNQDRDFTFVDDIAKGTIAALNATGYEIFNLGSSSPVRLIDALHTIEQAVGKTARVEINPQNPLDIQGTCADISKARQFLSWYPRFDFKEGIQRLVDWYRDNREWAKQISTLP